MGQIEDITDLRTLRSLSYFNKWNILKISQSTLISSGYLKISQSSLRSKRQKLTQPKSSVQHQVLAFYFSHLIFSLLSHEHGEKILNRGSLETFSCGIFPVKSHGKHHVWDELEVEVEVFNILFCQK